MLASPSHQRATLSLLDSMQHLQDQPATVPPAREGAGGLSGPAIAAIVLGCVAFAVLAAVAMMLLKLNRRRSKASRGVKGCSRCGLQGCTESMGPSFPSTNIIPRRESRSGDMPSPSRRQP